MEIAVVGAASKADARTIAKSVAGSSLTKSAIFGHDPNWGRIAAAAGYSGARRAGRVARRRGGPRGQLPAVPRCCTARPRQRPPHPPLPPPRRRGL
jgi:hypothetical protein